MDLGGIEFLFPFVMFQAKFKKWIFKAITHISKLRAPWQTAHTLDVIPRLDWLRVSPPLNAIDLSEDFNSGFVRAKEIPQRRVFMIRNAYVTSQGVVFKNLRIFMPSLPWSKDLENFRKGEILSQQFRELRRISNTRVILGFDQWALSNYYHWMIESLPRLYLATKMYPDAMILIPESVHGFVNETLELMEMTGLVRIEDNEIVRIDELIIPEIVYYSGVENQDNPPPDLDTMPRHPVAHEELIIPVRRKLLENFPLMRTPWRNVYVSRSRARMRRLTNENSIMPVLEKFGFEIVFFEDLSFIEQLRLMRETKVLAGVHGANMVNILFMAASTTLIELMNEHHLNDAYYLLASTIGVNYFSVPCQMADETIRNSNDTVLINDADLVVERTFFESVLSKACNISVTKALPATVWK